MTTKRAAVLFLLLCASEARAETAPPARGPVPVVTIFEGFEDFPDHAFFEMSYSTERGPMFGMPVFALHFVPRGRAVQITGDRNHNRMFYAVPKAAVEGVPGWKELAAARLHPPKHMTAPAPTWDWLELANRVNNNELPDSARLILRNVGSRPASTPGDTVELKFRLTRTPRDVSFVEVPPPPPSPQLRCASATPRTAETALRSAGTPVQTNSFRRSCARFRGAGSRPVRR